MSKNENEQKSDVEGDLGYVFYTKRKNLIKTKEESTIPISDIGTSISLHKKCLKNAIKCIKEDPFAKLLIKALRSKGCEFNPERHLSCEPCLGIASGGFDANFRQIAICENNANNYNLACGVLKHELIHAFDYCRAKVNFLTDLRHIACTEIRAANFMHCSYLSALVTGIIPFTQLKKMHEICVKEKAALSVLAVRNVSHDEGCRVVDEVFDTCYKDLEPFGRKIKKRTFDADARRAYFEAKYYGYYKDDDEDD